MEIETHAGRVFTDAPLRFGAHFTNNKQIQRRPSEKLNSTPTSSWTTYLTVYIIAVTVTQSLTIHRYVGTGPRG